MPFIVVYVTHPDEASAKSISRRLLEAKIVACANIFPISSAYWWNSTIQNDQEWVSLLKTTPGLWQKLQEAVSSLHPYEVPCILKFEVEANAAYEKWIYDSVEGAKI
jgi:periplasmic divalent cation tolerance protein